MSEPDCHYHHTNFSPNQECEDCGYKEPNNSENLSSLRDLIEKFFKYVDGNYYLKLDKEDYENLTSRMWNYDENINTLLEHLIRICK